MEIRTLQARRRALAFAALAGAVLVSAACGGGDAAGVAASSGAPVVSAEPAAPGPAATPAATDVTCGEAGFQETALRLLNERRAAGASCGSAGVFGGTTAVAASAALTEAAASHSLDMATHDYFDHTGSDGSTPGARIAAAGYTWSTYGENIAGGQPNVATVIDGWMASPGHCRNIMTPAFRDIGIACARNDASALRRYYTLVLAAPR